MKNHPTKRRTHHRNSGSDYTSGAAIHSIIRGVQHRAVAGLNGPHERPLTRCAVASQSPRTENSVMTGVRVDACMPPRPA